MVLLKLKREARLYFSKISRPRSSIFNFFLDYIWNFYLFKPLVGLKEKRVKRRTLSQLLTCLTGFTGKLMFFFQKPLTPTHSAKNTECIHLLSLERENGQKSFP